MWVLFCLANALFIFSFSGTEVRGQEATAPPPSAPVADAPPTPELYNEVKALADGGDWDGVRRQLAEIYPRRAEHKIYAWSTWAGAAALARNSSDRAERMQAWQWALDACDHLESEKAGRRNRAIARNGLIPDIAREDLDQARALATQTLADLGESDLVTDIHYTIGIIELRRRHWGRAEAAIRAASAAAAEDDPLDRATVAGFRGLYALELGRIEVAAVEFTDEEAHCRELGFERESHRHAKRRSILHLLKLYLATDRAGLLERVIDETLAIEALIDEAPGFGAELELLRGIARMAEERLGASFDRSAEQIFEGLVTDPSTPPDIARASGLRLAHLLTNRGEIAAADRALTALPSAPQGLDLGYAAVIRARILRGGQDSDRNALEEALRGLEAAWEQVRATLLTSHEGESEQVGSGILHYERVRLLQAERIETALALAALEEHTDAEIGRPAFEILAELGTLGELHRAFDAPTPTLAATREKLLPPDGGIAMFFPAPDRSHLVLVESDRITHVPLPPRDAIERARRALDRTHGAVPTGGSKPSEERRTHHAELSRALAALLLPAEAEARIAKWNALSVVGLDLLRLFPIAELRLQDGTTLGSRLAISALPSLSVGLFLADRRTTRLRSSAGASDADGRSPESTRREKAVLVAAPTLSSETEQQFPRAGSLRLEESKGRAPLTRYAASTLAREGDATWEQTLAAVDGETAVLQLLLHGARDPNNLGSTALLFAGDRGVIGPDQIGELEAPPLVLATACGSGLGAPRLGDPGSADLMGAFLRSGAEAVVISIGDLSYQATLASSTIIHEALAGGATPAAALRALHVEGTERDPAHRSSLIVFGLGHTPVIDAAATRGQSVAVTMLIGVVVVVGLIGACAHFGRRRRI